MGGRGSTSSRAASPNPNSVENLRRLNAQYEAEDRAAERFYKADRSVSERRAAMDEASRIAVAANEQARNDNERTILSLNQRNSYYKPDVTTTVIALEGLPVGTTIVHSVQRRSGITGGVTGNGYGESIFTKTRSGEWRSGSTGYGLGNSLWTPEDVAGVLRTSTGIRIERSR